MALNSTSRRRYGALLAAATTGAVAAIIGLASPASAHTPKSGASCNKETGLTTLWVDLKSYNKQKPNTIEITNGGETVLEKTEFGETFKKEWTVPGDVAYVFKINVEASDGDQFDYKEIHKVEACVKPSTTPPTETTTTTTTTTSEEPTTTPPSETTTTTTTTPVEPTTTTQPTPSNVAGEDELAETGASIALPLGIAGVLLVGGLVALFVVRRRSRA